MLRHQRTARSCWWSQSQRTVTTKNSNTLSLHNQTEHNWTEMLWKWSVLWDWSCSHYSDHTLSVSVKCSNGIQFQNLGGDLCKSTQNIRILTVPCTFRSSSSECSHNREGDTTVLLIFPQAEPSLFPSTFPFRACEEHYRIRNPNTVHITVRIIYLLTGFLKFCIYININYEVGILSLAFRVFIMGLVALLWKQISP